LRSWTPSSSACCDHCGKALPLTARPDQRYCSHAHRQAAYERRRGPVRTRPVMSPSGGGSTRESDPILVQLEAALERATEEVRLVALDARAAQTQWRASAGLLERQYPERWGRRDRGATPPAVMPPADDPFFEVDQLAEQRRKRTRPDGY
jgi:hypothetical protein